MKFYKRIEERFMDNLNKRQSMQVFTIPEILQENCHLQKMTLSPDSLYSGQVIKETDFRDNYNDTGAYSNRARFDEWSIRLGIYFLNF